MKLDTFIWHALLRACAKFVANRTLGGTIIKLYVKKTSAPLYKLWFSDQPKN